MQARSFLTELAEIAVLALGLYIVIQFAVQTVHVIGLSMYPTLDNDNYLIASKLDYRVHQPGRGDIIIMRDPYDESKDFIKRVVALPGERLLIREGHVFINGRELDEPYLRDNEPWTSSNNWPAGGAPDGEVLSNDSYFVMGDNRNRSSDSRFFGPIRRNRIEARAWVRLWPLNRAGIVDSHPSFKTALGPASLAA
jgi:signal peptidase I